MSDISDAVIDWEKFPKLAEIFKRRPRHNLYWLELMRLARELVKQENKKLS